MPVRIILAVFGATAAALVLVAPKLAWVWLLAPIPILYVAVVSQGLIERSSDPGFLSDYASAGIVASTGAWIWAGTTDRTSALVAVSGAALVAGSFAFLAPPLGPGRIAFRTRGILSRYGKALRSLGKETRNGTHTVDPVGCVVGLSLGFAMGVLLLVVGIIVELLLVPAGLVVFGAIVSPIRLASEKNVMRRRSQRVTTSMALATESGVIVAAGIMLAKN